MIESKHFRVNVRLATFPAAVSSRRPPALAARQTKDTLNDKAPVEKEGQNGGFSKALNWAFACRSTEFLLLSSNACFGGHFPNTGERTGSTRGRQPIKVEGRPGKVTPSISWVWGVRKRRPKCSLGHFQSELSLEIRFKRKPPPQENHWAKETGRLGDFSMWKHRKPADTHTHTHTHTRLAN